eukprot:CAMPEP_0198723792 /NCGR_PEP_ID=MMETSP1475-20131203/1312_1 /TAXON_ID= ORGANISM="Unidentified sp., Strain CCMP1999" /NCGR_SAMPLE_ID=MMETSP1475 /ASSEMBLY_ACC=CAM_ASM_001111 /LENGTH=610 /DNA_ID=CAMNT_0044485079 /DNA_START=577 /DNA_END=2409 /DNA_ORIENTATION=+
MDVGSEDEDNSNGIDENTCPICRENFREAHVTPCGHMFCFQCIQHHLETSSTCPQTGCDAYLTVEQLQPNIARRSERDHRYGHMQNHSSGSSQTGAPISTSMGGMDHNPGNRMALASTLMADVAGNGSSSRMERATAILSEATDNLNSDDLQWLKRRLDDIIRQSTRRADDELILRFMEKLRLRRVDEISRLQQEVNVLTTDVKTLSERIGSRRNRRVEDDPAVAMRMKRVEDNCADLERLWLEGLRSADRQAALEQFSEHVNQFTKYSALQLVSSCRHGRRIDGEHSSVSAGGESYPFPNIVTSIELDKEEKRVATAGVLKQIKIFEVSSLMDTSVQVHFPVRDINTSAKVSSLSWNKYIGSWLISADYDGVVTLWDAERGDQIRSYDEHDKRIWSVDFSRNNVHMFASGSNDAKVKIWTAHEDSSSLTIENRSSAQVCSVKFCPRTQKVVFGCADTQVHCHDLRHPRQPLYTLRDHDHAVSYVAFMDENRLVTASTDSTLKLWDLKCSPPRVIRTFRGHRNRINFVGLSVKDEYIACGSEDNNVYVYYHGVSRPCISYPFGSMEPGGEDVETNSNQKLFVSAVSWCANDPPILFAANSQGTVRMFKMT